MEKSIFFHSVHAVVSPSRSHSGDVSVFYKVELISEWCGSLSFLDNHGIDLIRPIAECVEGPNQLSVMTEAEVLSALQVGNLFRRNVQFLFAKRAFVRLL